MVRLIPSQSRNDLTATARESIYQVAFVGDDIDISGKGITFLEVVAFLSQYQEHLFQFPKDLYFSP